MLQKVKKHIITSIIISAVLYLLLSLYADYHSVIESIKHFGFLILPLLLALSFLNYFTRFLKWHYYLGILNIHISFGSSFLVFMSGLIMSVTPGKFGEVLKSFMLKDIAGEPISKTAPIMIVERITDFLSLIFVALIGSYFYGIGKELVIGTAIFFLLIVVMLSNKTYADKLFDYMLRFEFVSKFIPKVKDAYGSSYLMLKPGPLIKMFLLSIVAWFFECFAFYLILVKFNITITVLWASFTYAFSTILGSITMLPAGLGVTEGSLTYLMINEGISKNIAVSATFFIRVITLWFAIFVGIVSIMIYQRKYGKFESNRSK